MAEIEFCALDVGISTTDAVAGWAEEVSVSLPTVSPEASAKAALDRLLELAPPPRRELCVAATGVGSRRLPERVSGLAVRRISEMTAIGRGGIGLAGVPEALVASLGTGTAMVSVRGAEMTHVVPGNGVGGGTLLGLGRALLGTADLDELARLARLGDRTRLDITIGEAVGGPLGALPENGTASNFAKYASSSRREDVAAALLNLIAEVVLWTILLGLQASGQARAILTGKLLLVEPIRRRMAEFSPLLGGALIIPERAGIASALGALWSARGAEDR
ncbi:MAG: Fumble domain-containing protein [Candidatus Binatia bacterium]